MNVKTVNLIQLNAAVLIWGGTAMFAKGIKLPVADIICFRALIAAAVLFLLLRLKNARVRPTKIGDYGLLLLMGLLLCLHWLTYFQALKVSTAAVAILALHTYPVCAALVEPFLFGEKLRRSDLGLALIVFVGVVIMTPEVSLSNTTTQGIALGIISGLLFMGRNLLTRKLIQEYSGSMLMFWQGMVTGILLIPLLATRSDVTAYSLDTVGLLVLLGVLFTALPQSLFSSSFKSLSVKTASILATLLPFYGAFFGYLIHHEVVTLRTALGGMLILACIAIETMKTVQR